MNDRIEVLEFINELIVDNNGDELTEPELMRNSGLDSFGNTMLYLALDDEYKYFDIILKGMDSETDPFTVIDFENISMADLLDQICT